jgi:hypothetical protein
VATQTTVKGITPGKCPCGDHDFQRKGVGHILILKKGDKDK